MGKIQVFRKVDPNANRLSGHRCDQLQAVLMSMKKVSSGGPNPKPRSSSTIKEFVRISTKKQGEIVSGFDELICIKMKILKFIMNASFSVNLSKMYTELF